MTAYGRTRIAKALASVLMLLVVCMNFPIQAFADTLSVNLEANGVKALTLATSTDSFTVTLSTTGATACQMTSPVASGIATSTSSTIDPSHPWYPVAGGTTTFTVTCTDGTSNQSDTVTVSLPAAQVATLSADIKINGSDGPVTLQPGDSYTYTWSSQNATACQMTSPAASGISTSGTSVAITSGHPWYPTATSSVTLSITCTNGTSNVSDSVTVSLASGGGGGGGGGAVSADIKANGSDGPTVTIAPGSSYTYTWSSQNATACQMTSPAASGISTSGTSVPIDPSHPWYPTATSSVTLSITCTNGVSNASDSVTVALSSAVSVDVKINGSDGPVTITNGTPWTYTWSSQNATACQMTSPAASGISTSGTSVPINPGHPWYPAIGGSTTVTVTCTNGVSNATDSAVVNVVAQSGGGGGGGGGGSSSTASSVTPVNTGAACLYVRDYMRMDFQNNPQEVMKLQAFLRVFEGYDYVQITGTFDQATFNAVSAFQVKYRTDILDPWALKGPTGYVYILTLKKINEIYCLHTFPLNEAQQQEIASFRALVSGLRARGINVDLPVTGSRTIEVPVTRTETDVLNASTSATTTVSLPIVGTATSSQGQNKTTLAAVLFASPTNVTDGLQCAYEFLLVLIVLYILGSVLEDVLYKKEDVTKVRARFFAKWATIALGLIIAMIVAYKVNEWCLMLPLLIALIISLVWTALYPKHQVIRTTTKTWIPVRKTGVAEEKKV